MPIREAKKRARMKSSRDCLRRSQIPMSSLRRVCRAMPTTSISPRKVTGSSECVTPRRCSRSWGTRPTNPNRRPLPMLPGHGLEIDERVGQFSKVTRRKQMKRFCIILITALCCALIAGRCYAQEAGGFQPATTNVWGAEYPRVDGTGRVQLRVKAADATKVRVNFWSGPKADMVKQADGFWTFTTPPLVPGLHYYTFVIDGAEVSDTSSQAFFGGSKYASAVEVPEPGSTYYAIQDVPHGQVREG